MPAQYAADAAPSLGPRHDGVIGTASDPVGTDLILAIVSSQPLFTLPRPKTQESADTYLTKLQAAIDLVRRDGGSVSVKLLSVHIVRTELVIPRPPPLDHWQALRLG